MYSLIAMAVRGDPSDRATGGSAGGLNRRWCFFCRMGPYTSSQSLAALRIVSQ